MGCYPNTNFATSERPTCGPTDPNLYANKAETTEEVVFPEGIKDIGDGKVKCVVCDKTMNASKLGVASHVRSAAHKTAIEENVVETKEIIESAENEVIDEPTV